jgi:hypothetical protein
MGQRAGMTGRQTIWGSIVEAKANIAIGFTINYFANLLILPLFGFESLTPAKNLAIGVLYTVISILRQFVLRRFFNGLTWGHK